MTNSLTLDTLGNGRPKAELNRHLVRLSRLHQSPEDVHEVTLKVWIRPAPNRRNKKTIRWDVRSNVSSRRQEISQASGKTKSRSKQKSTRAS